MFQIKSKAEQLCMQILKPSKNDYRVSDLGIPCFNNDGVNVNRHEIEIASSSGLFMHTSFFDTDDKEKRNTCIIYLHSISGSRLEAMPAMREITKLGYSFACFDFPGCGYSEGDMVTLGMREKEDLRQVIKYIKASQSVQNIILWGKSMGAVTALLYACKYEDVVGVIADSAFSNLKKLILEMCQHYVGLPDFILKLFRNYLSSIIEEKIPIKVEDIDLLQKIANLRAPVLYMASPDDELVSNNHSKEMYRLTRSPKRLLEINGNHNSLRPNILYQRVAQIIQNIINTGTPKESNAENESIPSHISTIDSFQIKKSYDSIDSNNSRARKILEGRHKASYSPNYERRAANPYRVAFNSPGNRFQFSQQSNSNEKTSGFKPNSNIKPSNNHENENYTSEYDTLQSFHSNMIPRDRKATYDVDASHDLSDTYKTLRARVFTSDYKKENNSALSTIKGISRVSRRTKQSSKNPN